MKIQDEFWENVMLMENIQADVTDAAKIHQDARDSMEVAKRKLEAVEARESKILTAIANMMQLMSPVEGASLYVDIIKGGPRKLSHSSASLIIHHFSESLLFWKNVAQALTLIISQPSTK